MLRKASFSHFYSFFFFSFWFIMLMFIILQPVTSARKLAGNAPSKIAVKPSPLPPKKACSTYNRCRRGPPPSPKKAPPCSIYNRCRRGPPPPPPPPPSP